MKYEIFKRLCLAFQVGIGKEQEMRIVLDSDEERFGGHCRLEEGHGKLPMGGPTHNRPEALEDGLSSSKTQGF